MNLKVNGKERAITAPEEMPLLWVLRDPLRLTGTKYGCGMVQCGAALFTSRAGAFLRPARRSCRGSR